MAKLQGAWLEKASVWRAVGSDADVRNAFIENVDTSRNFAACKDDPPAKETDCRPWTHDDFVAWRADLEKQVPAGADREDMLRQIQSLDPDPAAPFKDEAEVKQQWEDWQAHSASKENAESERAEQLGTAGCAAEGPAVITALIARWDNAFFPLFAPDSRNRATLAKAFLAPDCAGARGLAPAQITALRLLAADPAAHATK